MDKHRYYECQLCRLFIAPKVDVAPNRNRCSRCGTVEETIGPGKRRIVSEGKKPELEEAKAEEKAEAKKEEEAKA